MKLLISIIILSVSFSSYAKKFKGFNVDSDELNKKYKIKLTSGKKDDVRLYHGIRVSTFDKPLEYVKQSITNFEDKCNNEYKKKRKLINKKKECRYHNGNLIESKIYKDLKKYEPLPNEVERYLVARRIYNRENFSHMDMIQVFEKLNEQGQKEVTIRVQMLSDKKVKKYMKPIVKRDSVFQDAYSEFKLTQVEENKTKLEYSYFSETDHWLLNKSVSVGKVFDSMAKSIDLLFFSIKKELSKIKSNKIIKNATLTVQKTNQ